RHLRRRTIAIALSIGALLGLGRMAQGAHFLSDVVYAGLLVYGTTAVLYWWIVEHDGLVSPLFLRVYHSLWGCTAAAWALVRRSFAVPIVSAFLLTAAAGMLIGISAEIIDRPLALFFHARDPDFRAFFDLTGRFGLTYGYLTVFGFAFVTLH